MDDREHTILVFNQAAQANLACRPFVDRHNEYWRLLWPPLRNSSLITRTVGLLTLWLAINAAGHSADLGCMLA